MQHLLAVSLRAIFSLALLPTATLCAADAPGAKDHPLLKRVAGSEIIWYKYSKFDEMIIALEKVAWDPDAEKFKQTKTEKLTGTHTILYYKLPGDNRSFDQYKIIIKFLSN